MNIISGSGLEHFILNVTFEQQPPVYNGHYFKASSKDIVHTVSKQKSHLACLTGETGVAVNLKK